MMGVLEVLVGRGRKGGHHHHHHHHHHHYHHHQRHRHLDQQSQSHGGLRVRQQRLFHGLLDEACEGGGQGRGERR